MSFDSQSPVEARAIAPMARYDPFARNLLTVLMDGVAYVARKHAPP